MEEPGEIRKSSLNNRISQKASRTGIFKCFIGSIVSPLHAAWNKNTNVFVVTSWCLLKFTEFSSCKLRSSSENDLKLSEIRTTKSQRYVTGAGSVSPAPEAPYGRGSGRNHLVATLVGFAPSLSNHSHYVATRNTSRSLLLRISSRILARATPTQPVPLAVILVFITCLHIAIEKEFNVDPNCFVG